MDIIEVFIYSLDHGNSWEEYEDYDVFDNIIIGNTVFFSLHYGQVVRSSDYFESWDTIAETNLEYFRLSSNDDYLIMNYNVSNSIDSVFISNDLGNSFEKQLRVRNLLIT